MSQGRGSASAQAIAIIMVVTLLFMFIQLGQVEAATYTVGGSSGWSFNIVNWPKGKRFGAGDTLVFNYDPTKHDVVAVNGGGYSSCKTPAGSKVYKSGKDQIKLVKGVNYFICNFPGHCESNMKIAVPAA